MEKTRKLLRQTVDKASQDMKDAETSRKGAEGAKPGIRYTTSELAVVRQNVGLPGSVGLRLDWEWEDEKGDIPFERKLDLMYTMVYDDLIDLLENGDSMIVADPLLKALDGVRAKGKEPVDVQIISQALMEESKPKKNSTEYTIWLTLYVKWD